MSSMSMWETPTGVLAAWETSGQTYRGRINPTTLRISAPKPASGSTGNRKHPVIAANARGEMLFAWTEGTGWKRGGSLAYQTLDPSGRPLGAVRRVANGIPVWGLPTAVALKDGSFLLVH